LIDALRVLWICSVAAFWLITWTELDKELVARIVEEEKLWKTQVLLD
jgi:hypothetical protein